MLKYFVKAIIVYSNNTLSMSVFSLLNVLCSVKPTLTTCVSPAGAILVSGRSRMPSSLIGNP